MTIPIETVTVSQAAKEQLIKLKRYTGLEHWNVLCRWAFCASLAEPSIPPQAKIPTDSTVEMTWKVFGGTHQDLYLGMLKERCRADGLGVTPDVLASQFRLHLHRGIGYLAADRQIRSVSTFLRRVVPRR